MRQKNGLRAANWRAVVDIGTSCPSNHSCSGCRDDQLLTGLDLIGVLQLVRLRDLLIFIGIAVKLLADLR